MAASYRQRLGSKLDLQQQQQQQQAAPQIRTCIQHVDCMHYWILFRTSSCYLFLTRVLARWTMPFAVIWLFLSSKSLRPAVCRLRPSHSSSRPAFQQNTLQQSMNKLTVCLCWREFKWNVAALLPMMLCVLRTEDMISRLAWRLEAGGKQLVWKSFFLQLTKHPHSLSSALLNYTHPFNIIVMNRVNWGYKTEGSSRPT